MTSTRKKVDLMNFKYSLWHKPIKEMSSVSQESAQRIVYTNVITCNAAFNM